MAEFGVVDLSQEDDDDDPPAAHGHPPPAAHGHPPPANNQAPGHNQFQLWIPMAPLAKPSVSFGKGRGGVWRAYFNNKATAARNEMKAFVQQAAAAVGFQQIPRNQPVEVKAWFFLKRPNDDFIGRRRGIGRLKESVLHEWIVPVKPDTDNMAKLLLDALTGVLFVDDAQVTDMHMWKLRDSIGLCEGRVAIEVNLFDKPMASILPSFPLE
jgi:Holliday junction resolvase RusA-like endonuclease